jgi:16S rRNA A1518/A1519 N6-dimethyltransferase RsmA/KsgA/DIM1 with predicted DNA glycosylase/AP lyase activity
MDVVIADGVMDALRPFLGPRKTLIDVGAGDGRRAAALAAELDWVTAVEPSDELRARIPDSGNMTVIAARWEDADVQAADLVVCAGAAGGAADPAAFVAKLEEAATERVFVTLDRGVADVLAALGVRFEMEGGVAHWRPGARA